MILVVLLLSITSLGQWVTWPVESVARNTLDDRTIKNAVAPRQQPGTYG